MRDHTGVNADQDMKVLDVGEVNHCLQLIFT